MEPTLVAVVGIVCALAGGALSALAARIRGNSLLGSAKREAAQTLSNAEREAALMLRRRRRRKRSSPSSRGRRRRSSRSTKRV